MLRDTKGERAGATTHGATRHQRPLAELNGPRDMTMREVTRVIGAALGRPDLRYVQFDDASMQSALIAGGLSAEIAANFVEMTGAFNAGRIVSVRTPESTTPTTFEEFVQNHMILRSSR